MLKQKHEKSRPDRLPFDVLRTRPASSNPETLLTELADRLEQFAKKARVSVNEFLVLAESEAAFNEDYLEALTIARQIARLKLQR